MVRIPAVGRVLTGERRTIVRNASFLTSTTVATSVLGFAYWWAAARTYPAQEVGIAAATVSAMTLLGIVGMLGLGTLLISEVHARGDRALAYVVTAVIAAAGAGALLGLIALLLARLFSPELAAFARDPVGEVLFPVGVALTASTLVIDQALIGMLRGGTQFLRNVAFAGAKLVLLVAMGSLIAIASGATIFASWVAGLFLSVLLIAALALRQEHRWSAYRPDAQILRNLGRGILKHHSLNLAVQAPSLALPVLVATTLSATAAGYFYAAWMMAGFVGVATPALGFALFAVGTRSPAELAHSMRLTLALSILIGGAGILGALVVGRPLLDTFGKAYGDEAFPALVLLTLATLPGIVKTHFTQIARLGGRLGFAAAIMAAGATLELAAAAIGAHRGGLLGVSLGYLAAVCFEAVVMGPAVLAAAGVGRRVRLRAAAASTPAPGGERRA